MKISNVWLKDLETALATLTLRQALIIYFEELKR